MFEDILYLTFVVGLVRSPLVSFLYERGWRQNFNRSGFPGPDEEVGIASLFILQCVEICI